MRAIAISCVLLGHMSLVQGSIPFKQTWIDLGEVGVWIFFVISGFLITTLLLEERAQTGDISISRFYQRRAFRILPALVVYIIGAGVMRLLGWTSLSFASLFQPFTFLMNYIPGMMPIQHLWSLSVEEQYYLAWPVLLRGVTPSKAKTVLWSVLLLAPVLRTVLFVTQVGAPLSYSWHFESVADAMAIGSLIAFPGIRLQLERIVRRFRFGYWGIAGTVAAASLHQFPIVYQLVGKTLMLGGIAASLIWLVNDSSSQIAKMLNAKPLVHLGKMSYSLYLWQQVFTLTPHDYRFFANVPLNIAIPFVLAYLSYRWVELPAIRRGKALMMPAPFNSV